MSPARRSDCHSSKVTSARRSTFRHASNVRRSSAEDRRNAGRNMQISNRAMTVMISHSTTVISRMDSGIFMSALRPEPHSSHPGDDRQRRQQWPRGFPQNGINELAHERLVRALWRRRSSRVSANVKSCGRSARFRTSSHSRRTSSDTRAMGVTIRRRVGG